MSSNARTVLRVLSAAAVILSIHGFTLPIVGDDAWIHLAWLDQFHLLQTQGVEYPRWLTQSYGGFGSPSFYFYPPLPYFLGSAIQFVSGLSFAGLYQVLTFIATALSAVTCFYYLRTLGAARSVGAAAAIFYAIAPYRFVDLYARNALGEHFSFVFLPLILAGLELARSGSDRRSLVKVALLSAIGWAGVVLTNIPAAVICAIVFVIYATVRLRASIASLAGPIAGGILAALCCAVYLLPVFELREYTQMNHIFDIGSQEQRWSFIVIEIFQADLTVARVLNALTLLLGVAALSVAIMRRGEKGTPVTASIILLGVAILFQIPGLASLLFQITPIDLIKYSWRWNVVLTLGLAVAIAHLISTGKERLALGIVLISTGVTLAMSIRFESEHQIYKPYESLRESYMDAPEYVPVHAPKEYWQVVEFGKINKHVPPVIYDKRAGMVRQTKKGPERMTYAVDFRSKARVIFHQFYWPQWQLWREDYQIPLGYDEYGRAVAELEPGTYEVQLKLLPTDGQEIGAILSGLGAILLLGCVGLIFSSLKPRGSV